MAAVAAVATAAGALHAPMGAIGPLAGLVVKELSSQVFALTASQLSTQLTQMLALRSTDVVQTVQEHLLSIIPTARLRVMQCVLLDFEWLRAESKTVDAFCERLTELVQSIHSQTQVISHRVHDYNQLYFRSWRTLDVAQPLAIIRANVRDLEETFAELKGLLPSCLAVVQARPKDFLVPRAPSPVTANDVSLILL